MAKGIQTYIPSVETPKEWQDVKLGDLRRFIFEYVRNNYAGRIIENKHTKLKIKISVSGGRKTAMGGAIYRKKASAILILPQIIEYAQYNNFGAAKDSDGANVLGYLNFKCKCKIDGVLENIRLAIQFQKGGKFYYNLEINRKIGSTPERSKA